MSLALVLLMLPVVVRTPRKCSSWCPTNSEKPATHWAFRNGRPSCGSSCRSALPGIVSGSLLSIARVIGETAPVLVLVGYSRSINFDIFHGNMASLPLLIYTELTNPEHAGFLRIWGAALTLIIVVGVLNLLAAAATRILTARR